MNINHKLINTEISMVFNFIEKNPGQDSRKIHDLFFDNDEVPCDNHFRVKDILKFLVEIGSIKFDKGGWFVCRFKNPLTDEEWKDQFDHFNL